MRNTPVSRLFFMKTSEIHPYLGYFFQKQMRYTRIPIIFDKNKRSAPVSPPFFSKTGEKHPYLSLFLSKTRERWPCYGGFNQNRSIRRAVSFVFHKNSWNRPTFSTFFLKNKRKRWAYSMIFTKNSTERWPCSVVLPTRNKKNMLPSAGSISFNVVHSVVLRKENSPKTIMQQNEHLHIITL